jgi:hypothetical protein
LLVDEGDVERPVRQELQPFLCRLGEHDLVLFTVQQPREEVAQIGLVIDH